MVQMENTRESKLRTKHGRGSEGEEATWETWKKLWSFEENGNVGFGKLVHPLLSFYKLFEATNPYNGLLMVPNLQNLERWNQHEV